MTPDATQWDWIVGQAAAVQKLHLTLHFVNEQGHTTAASRSRGDGVWWCPWKENWYYGTKMGQAQFVAGEEKK